MSNRTTSSHRPKVLVVEDDLTSAGNLLQYLEMHDYRADAVNDGSAAMIKIDAEDWDVVILDIGLPLADGFEVLQHMRGRLMPTLPVLMLTARGELDERLRAFRLGADDYLQKPFALAEMDARIRALLRRASGSVVPHASPHALTFATDIPRPDSSPRAATIRLEGRSPCCSGEAMPSPQAVLSVIIPARDEGENLPRLLDEISTSLRDFNYEILVVDDGSTDATWRLLSARAESDPRVRPLRHAISVGQSTAVWQAALVARGAWLATLDGDGQNDPADIPRLLARALQGDVALVAGHRASRKDSWMKRMSSRVANRVRSTLLGDGTPDTGCGLKLIQRSAFMTLPYFDHMHRFLPALIQAQGGRCVSVSVSHRPRLAGKSHYGVNNRLWVGLVDLLGVLWLRRRSRLPAPLQGDAPAKRVREATLWQSAGAQE